ncbi:MAG TPA: hypothetical protein PK876_02400 [Elusimicrobiota bacterium]|nr:hypothetical protein [Elusimicrobiota bacterium]
MKDNIPYNWADLEHIAKEQRRKYANNRDWWLSKYWLPGCVKIKLKKVYEDSIWNDALKEATDKKANINVIVAIFVYWLWCDELPIIHHGHTAAQKLSKLKIDLNRIADYVDKLAIPFLNYCESEMENDKYIVGIGEKYSDIPRRLREIHVLLNKYHSDLNVGRGYDNKLDVGIALLADHFKHITTYPQYELISKLLTAAGVKQYDKNAVQQQLRRAIQRSKLGRFDGIATIFEKLMPDGGIRKTT